MRESSQIWNPNSITKISDLSFLFRTLQLLSASLRGLLYITGESLKKEKEPKKFKMKSNDLQKAQKRRYKDRRESSTTAKENDIRKERVRDNIIVETSNDDDFFTNNANSFNENAATAASHTQIVEVDDHLHHNNGSDDNYNNHASCSADSTSEGDRHSSLDVEILPSDESSSSQTFFQFDPSRMASIIKRRAMIKQLAASYHAECLSRCQKLVALQRIWEKEKEQ